MITALVTWLTSKGVSMLLGYAFNFLLDVWKTSQANEAMRDAGRKEVEAAQAQAGKAAEAAIADEAAKPVDEDDAIKQMSEGNA